MRNSANEKENTKKERKSERMRVYERLSKDKKECVFKLDDCL